MEKLNLEETSNVIPLKSELSLPATREDLQTLFEQAVSEVGAAYVPGTLLMVESAQPELWATMQEAEDLINGFWLNSKTETVDPETIRDAVNRWKDQHLKARRNSTSTDKELTKKGQPFHEQALNPTYNDSL